MSDKHSNIGLHTIWDIHGCNSGKISFTGPVKELLNQIVDKLKLGKVSEAYKQFEPVGVTGFILLEESHISIHTWPEHNFSAIDVFSCKPFDIEEINAILSDFFETRNITSKVMERGILSSH